MYCDIIIQIIVCTDGMANIGIGRLDSEGI